MSDDTGKPRKEAKDAWDKWAIALQPLGGLLTALAVGYLTFKTSAQLGLWQDKEDNARVYTELLGQREAAETGLRKGMFDSILEAFLKNSSESGPKDLGKSLESDVLKLELLSYNFHESLDLTPLFKDLERRIEQMLKKDPGNPTAKDCLQRLRKVADDIVNKQFEALKNADGKNAILLFHGGFDDPVDPDPKYVTQPLVLGGVTYDISVAVSKVDPVTQELLVSLHVKTTDPKLGADQDPYPERDVEFWIGSFEFPMIDNTRLPNDQYCALVLKVYPADDDERKFFYAVHAICFPGSRASLQEKPYFDEVLDQLRSANSSTK